MNEVRIGIIGFGTVGAGVAECLLKNADAIAARTGVRPVLRRVADLDTKRDRGVKLPKGMLVADAAKILDDPEIDIVVELVGGTGAARQFIKKALTAGKSVVTANKALLSKHGAELAALADKSGADLFFEASVGGGIPVIKALREGLAADRILEIAGILNGTCNYILTRMEKESASFGDVLQAAQAAGFAEADPGLDIDGIDTAHKAAILASLAFGDWFGAEQVSVEGIRRVALKDIEYAAWLGYRVKLLAILKRSGDEVQLRVHPALVPCRSLLGHVDGVFNAVWINGEPIGHTLYYGRGAGRDATTSAVVADIVDCGLNLANGCRGRVPPLRRKPTFKRVQPLGELRSRYYIRLQVVDRPGVLAQYAGVFRDHKVSIASVTQKEEANPDHPVPLVIVTHDANEADVQAAVREIAELDIVSEYPVLLRIEDLP